MNVLNKGKILNLKAPCTVLGFCPFECLSVLYNKPVSAQYWLAVVQEHFVYFLSSLLCKGETSEANMNSLGHCMCFVNSHTEFKEKKKGAFLESTQILIDILQPLDLDCNLQLEGN